MEYFASDPRVLARINKHYKTGESLPLHVIEKLCATKKIFAAVELQAQLVFSAADHILRTPAFTSLIPARPVLPEDASGPLAPLWV